MFDYESKRWKHLAARIIRNAGYKCQIAKRYGKNVPAEVVHHIYPVDEYPEYAYSAWNLIALSRAAHNTLHDRNTGKLTAAGIALQRRVKIPWLASLKMSAQAIPAGVKHQSRILLGVFRS